mmetsp:Transcript_20944/g.60467  ORF Transcript_20944/g.60467 Transcript_20944/m.60467 type:complete len:347 (-) Transcript_20944:68-1108(-)|eukprot:CAMPEP_0176027918 /NCGR_PEP_ID=MMETSP0120_2-20121206/13695_1 /TAXON_ID=160619 /ORGANISM="Kryptoperidinium foliaceum, Strain CCMP 1326" /LENGTH=346 /DNA_ID=CAMNT_0017361123 /DNA_START=39 /DNA_END=1079 /DNA_ORIENTATION=-
MAPLVKVMVPEATAHQLPSDATSVAGIGLWVGFTLAVGAALALDLFWGSQGSDSGHHLRAALISSVAWLGLGLAFAGFLAITQGGSIGFTFLTGYLVEKSLSVDNLVVIALIFRSFRIKPIFQGPVLKWGILGAVVFRAVFIFAGVALLERFAWMNVIFAAILVWSAYKMFVDDEDDAGDELAAAAHGKGNSWMMRLLTAVIPYYPEARSTQFFERVDGQLCATPMLAALVVVELSDLLFAVDSIPCILGLTHDLFLVFSSNMLAILGLRSLYLLLAEALDSVGGLKKGLSIVLAFVGFKMFLGERFPLPQSASLLIIFGILGTTVALSTFGPHGKGKAKAVLLPM